MEIPAPVMFGPTFFARMGNETNQCDANDTTTLRAGDADFAAAQSAWAVGQLAGTLLVIGLPTWVGFRNSFLMLQAVAIVSALLYLLADPSVTGSCGALNEARSNTGCRQRSLTAVPGNVN